MEERVNTGGTHHHSLLLNCYRVQDANASASSPMRMAPPFCVGRGRGDGVCESETQWKRENIGGTHHHHLTG